MALFDIALFFFTFDTGSFLGGEQDENIYTRCIALE